MSTTRTIRAIRKEKPLPRPKPPARPPAPSGVHVPGGDSGTGMVCPGSGGSGRVAGAAPGAVTGTRTPPADRPASATGMAPAAFLRGGDAIEETVIDAPVQKVLRKPSALGGKSIHLQVVEGEMRGRSFDLTGLGTYVIGRKGCDIVVEDEKVSRKHASIVIARQGQYLVQDLASKNGTFVNGVRLSRRNLAHNDVIRVGNTTFRFTVFDGPVPVDR
jgi:hypothetical protein